MKGVEKTREPVSREGGSGEGWEAEENSWARKKEGDSGGEKSGGGSECEKR